jgi:hypothetical protein
LGAGEQPSVRSPQLETTLTEFLHEAAALLQAELDAGAEVPFELESRAARGGAQLYCYRPLPDVFIREHWPTLAALDSCAAAERLLECLQGLDRYLLQRDVRLGRGERRARAKVVLQTLLEDVFAEQSDFELSAERLRGAFAQLDAAAFTNGGEIALIETLHGMAVLAPELASTRAPAIGRPELAWALARFEMGCERSSELEALSDYLLALRALLEPEGPSSGLLAGRLAALCATPDERAGLTRRVLRAIALERESITGAAIEHPSCNACVAELAGHLRAVLRDAVCGHLPADLVACADALLVASGQTMEGPCGEEAEPVSPGDRAEPKLPRDKAEPTSPRDEAEPTWKGPIKASRRSGEEEVLGDAVQTAEILNVPV